MQDDFSLESAVRRVQQWKEQGEQVVFTNGVFDILHLGHVTYLQAAAQLGQRLIVGVNNDTSVRALSKGPERPINPEFARASVLAALRCVDAVVIFGEATPYDLIAALQPNVLVKGGDYDPNETNPEAKTYMVGSDLVRACGGQVAAIPLVDGFSTTGIVRRMKG